MSENLGGDNGKKGQSGTRKPDFDQAKGHATKADRKSGLKQGAAKGRKRTLKGSEMKGGLFGGDHSNSLPLAAVRKSHADGQEKNKSDLHIKEFSYATKQRFKLLWTGVGPFRFWDVQSGGGFKATGAHINEPWSAGGGGQIVSWTKKLNMKP